MVSGGKQAEKLLEHAESGVTGINETCTMRSRVEILCDGFLGASVRKDWGTYQDAYTTLCSDSAPTAPRLLEAIHDVALVPLASAQGRQ
jgi:hypothetical protein